MRALRLWAWGVGLAGQRTPCGLFFVRISEARCRGLARSRAIDADICDRLQRRERRADAQRVGVADDDHGGGLRRVDPLPPQ